jgi:hypothetical protein
VFAKNNAGTLSVFKILWLAMANHEKHNVQGLLAAG